MINQAYWEARAMARTAVYNRSAAGVVKATAAAINRSLATLKREMNDILRVFSDQYGMTRADALKLLEQPVDYATQQALKVQLAQITDPNARRVFQATINAPYYSARMTRAQALHDSIVVESTKVAEVEQEALDQHLQFAYIDGVDRFAYDVSKGFGRMLEFSEPSVSKAQEVLRHRWQGGNYSSRIWGNAKLMVKDLESALTENMLVGKTSDETWKALVQAANGEVAKAQRLIRTETAYIAGQAEKEGYNQAGFEHYKFVSRLEARTCKICGSLDGKVFPVRDAMPGKNMEPMHPWCMCTTMPWDEEMEELMRDETRWAKDPASGQAVEVHASMTYQEWKDQYNKLHPDMPLERERDKIYNRSADAKQYESYKSRLGKDFMPKTLDDFQNLKYNKGAAEQWADMKYYYRNIGGRPLYCVQIDRELEKIGRTDQKAMPQERVSAEILPVPRSRKPYHPMQRMLQRHITHDDVQNYIDNAYLYFEQSGAARLYVSDAGVSVVKYYPTPAGGNWICLSTWSKADYDEDMDYVLRVVKKYAGK